MTGKKFFLCRSGKQSSGKSCMFLSDGETNGFTGVLRFLMKSSDIPD